MADRESKEFITPNDKHKVIIKTYLNVGELREVERLFLSNLKMNDKGVIEQTYDGTIINRAQDKLLEMAIISINDDVKNILSRVLSFRKEDFDFLVEQLNEMKAGKFDDKKKLK